VTDSVLVAVNVALAVTEGVMVGVGMELRQFAQLTSANPKQ
jgi:hypothetical protein